MDYSKILETYTLTEILEYNDIAEEELIAILVATGYVDLPDPKPVDYETSI